MAEQRSEQSEPIEEQPEGQRSRPRRRFIIIGVVAILVVGALLWWWHSTYYEDTDDAQVDGNLVQISSRIVGHVQNVYVDQNQYVNAGDKLVAIDPHDYETALQQAEANLESAEASYEAARVNVPVIHTNTGTNLHNAGIDVASANEAVTESQNQLRADQARVVAAQANFEKARLDVQRYTPLVRNDVISKQQYDAAIATAEADKAAVDEAQADVVAAQDAVRIAHDRVTEAESSLNYAKTAPQQVAIQKAKADQAAAQVDQARAALAQAKLNLEYCLIVAPTAGIITTKSVQPGQNVAVGQALMTLVSLDDIWITANFKETQLEHMRTGQAVTIHVDAYDRDYDGKVTQIGGATGSMLSLFPPENATGNYVKVVQRIPVRIDLTKPEQNKDHLLRPGMSVEPKVRVKD
ncbi:MAG TPA: HlyD family secretion protein [Acidobacteriaceae bacterium]|nr:HlyD family secretion protein [Acidobacteriaceae bacterium]